MHPSAARALPCPRRHSRAWRLDGVLLIGERNLRVPRTGDVKQRSGLRRFHRGPETRGHRSEGGEHGRTLRPQQVGEVGAVRESGRVDSGVVQFEGRAQRARARRPRVSDPGRRPDPSPPASRRDRRAAGQTLEVHHDRLGPRLVQVRVLEVLHVVAVPVERQHQGRSALPAASPPARRRSPGACTPSTVQVMISARCAARRVGGQAQCDGHHVSKSRSARSRQSVLFKALPRILYRVPDIFDTVRVDERTVED